MRRCLLQTITTILKTHFILESSLGNGLLLSHNVLIVILRNSIYKTNDYPMKGLDKRVETPHQKLCIQHTRRTHLSSVYGTFFCSMI